MFNASSKFDIWNSRLHFQMLNCLERFGINYPPMIVIWPGPEAPDWLWTIMDYSEITSCNEMFSLRYRGQPVYRRKFYLYSLNSEFIFFRCGLPRFTQYASVVNQTTLTLWRMCYFLPCILGRCCVFVCLGDGWWMPGPLSILLLPFRFKTALFPNVHYIHFWSDYVSSLHFSVLKRRLVDTILVEYL